MEPTSARPRRGALRRALALFAVLGLLMGLAAACGDDDDDGDGGTTDDSAAEASGGGGTLEEVQDSGSITIGFANEVPYGFEGEDGEPTGEAPTVADEVLAELGVDEIEGVVVDFDSLIPGLNADRFDMIAAGMFITEERAEQALFSDPDYCAATAFAVEDGNPLGLEDFEDVAGDSDATLGVLGGAVEEGYATDLGVPEGQIEVFPTTADLFDGLTAGRIDAVALTSITVRDQVEDLDGYEATEAFIPVIDGEEQLGCGGYVFRQEDQDLRDAFNEILVEMRENDEILPLVEEFGFTEVEIDAAKGVTVEDLIG